MPLKLDVVYKHITESVVERKIYGYLSLMEICSKVQTADLNAEIFIERFNLMGKLVPNDGNRLFGDEETQFFFFFLHKQ